MTGATLPAPLVPADVDLSDFAFMPLDVRRLRDSRFTATIDGDAFKVGLLLWCASWHQHPAASLPDEDVELAQLAGFGRVVREWKKVRAEALYGWVLCSDGRLYHPTVAEKALESWESKMRHAYGKMVDRIRKANKARTAAGLPDILIPPFEVWNSTGKVDPSPPETPTPSVGIPAENALKGQGTEGTGRVEKEKSMLSHAPARQPAEQPPQLALVDPPPAKPKGPPDCPHAEVLALWAEVLPSLPQHLASQWKGARADHLRARWRETAIEKGWTNQAEGIAYLRRLFAYVAQSAFLTGRVPPPPGKRPFAIELEWLVNPTNWAKVIEGKYHQEQAA